MNQHINIHWVLDKMTRVVAKSRNPGADIFTKIGGKRY